MNIPSEISEVKNKFISHKRERVLSDDSGMNNESVENDDLPVIVIKPSTKYADAKDPDYFKPIASESRKSTQSSEQNKIICNCKNSQCLKFYCECFSQLLYCDPKVCSCKNCMNTEENFILRNQAINTYYTKSPNSFKKMLSSQLTNDKLSVSYLNLDSGVRSCTCKKSFCLKKYCECFQGGFKCTSHCKCVDCKNIQNNQIEKIETLNKINFPNRTNTTNKRKCSIFSVNTGKSHTNINPNKKSALEHNHNLIHQNNKYTKNKNSKIQKIFYKSKIEQIVPCKIIIHEYTVKSEFSIKDSEE